MTMQLKDPASFARELVARFTDGGWQSLGKRDLELLIYLLLEADGAIARTASNYEVARQLRITSSKVGALRRDAYARWRPLITETSADILKRVLKHSLDLTQLERNAKYATERRQKDGFLAVQVEHPDDRAELENAIKEAGAIPIYERNREVVLLHYETLFEVADKHGLIPQDAVRIQKVMKKLFKDETTLEGFLTSNLKDLTWQDARHALNLAGASVFTGSIEGAGPLLKLAFPFLG